MNLADIHLVFDLGGVVLPDLAGRLFEEIATKFGIDPRQADEVRTVVWEKHAHLPLPPDRCLTFQHKSFWREAAEGLGLTSRDDFVRSMMDRSNDYIQPFSGMLELLSELQSAGASLSILSDQTCFWKQRIVDQFGLTRYVDRSRMIFSCDTTASKCSPTFESFRALHDALGAPPKNRMLLIDDRTQNLTRAMEFGFGATVLVPEDPDFKAPYLRSLIRTIQGKEANCQ